MRNEERIEGRNGKGGELRYIRIWQGKREGRGWGGIESDGKMGRQGNWGSIELNWDCLSNFEEKTLPSISAQFRWHPANVICFESVCVFCTHGQALDASFHHLPCLTKFSSVCITFHLEI